MISSGLDLRFTRKLAPFLLSVELSIREGTLVLFGPSGSGKTRTLECIAGLETPESGHITLDGRILFRNETGGPSISIPPRLRKIGYVVQDGALFPHMSVIENVTYGIRGERRAGRARGEQLLDEMGISSLADRLPREISGGQQRRAAVARALATRPSLLLLDEPFIHLDRIVRARLMADLAALIRHHRTPAVIVTHDIEETVSLADHIAVFDEGRIIQHGKKDEVLFSPASCGIASLLGDVNVLPGTVIGEANGLWQIQTSGVIWNVAHVGTLARGGPVDVVIRTGAVKIIKPHLPVAQELSYNMQRGRVIEVTPRPGAVRIGVLLPGNLVLRGMIPDDTYHRADVKAGDERDFAVDPGGISLFPIEGVRSTHYSY